MSKLRDIEICNISDPEITINKETNRICLSYDAGFSMYAEEFTEEEFVNSTICINSIVKENGYEYVQRNYYYLVKKERLDLNKKDVS